MGYETTLYFVENDGYLEHDGATFCPVIATLDLKNAGNGALHALTKKRTLETPTVYVFSDDGNTLITRDRYDAPLSVMTPAEVLSALEKECEASRKAGAKPYRRFELAIAMIEALLNGKYCNLTVLGFGH
jgi:hypothetical protein